MLRIGQYLLYGAWLTFTLCPIESHASGGNFRPTAQGKGKFLWTKSNLKSQLHKSIKQPPKKKKRVHPKGTKSATALRKWTSRSQKQIIVRGWTQKGDAFVYEYQVNFPLAKGKKNSSYSARIWYAGVVNSRTFRRKEFLIYKPPKSPYKQAASLPKAQRRYRSYRAYWKAAKGKRGSSRAYRRWLRRNPLLKPGHPRSIDGSSFLRVSTLKDCQAQQEIHGNETHWFIVAGKRGKYKDEYASNCSTSIRWKYKAKTLWQRLYTITREKKKAYFTQISASIKVYWRPDNRGIALYYSEEGTQKSPVYFIQLLTFPLSKQISNTYRFQVKVSLPKGKDPNDNRILKLLEKWSKIGALAKYAKTSSYRGKYSVIYAAHGYRSFAKRLAKTLPGRVFLRKLRKHSPFPLQIQLGRWAWRKLKRKSKVMVSSDRWSGDTYRVRGWSHDGRYFVYEYEQTESLYLSSRRAKYALTGISEIYVRYAVVYDAQRKSKRIYLVRNLKKAKRELFKRLKPDKASRKFYEKKLKSLLRGTRKYGSAKRYKKWRKHHPLLRLESFAAPDNIHSVKVTPAKGTQCYARSRGSMRYRAKRPLRDEPSSQDHFWKINVTWRYNKELLWHRPHREKYVMSPGSYYVPMTRLHVFWRPDGRGLALFFTRNTRKSVRGDGESISGRVQYLSQSPRKDPFFKMSYPVQLSISKNLDGNTSQQHNLKKRLLKGGFKSISFQTGLHFQAKHIIYYHPQYRPVAQKIAKLLKGKSSLKILKKDAKSPILIEVGTRIK